MIRCVVCDCEVSGGLDTFGEVQQPMCRNCYMTLCDEHEPKRDPIAESLFGIVAGLTDTEEFQD